MHTKLSLPVLNSGQLRWSIRIKLRRMNLQLPQKTKPSSSGDLTIPTANSSSCLKFTWVSHHQSWHCHTLQMVSMWLQEAMIRSKYGKPSPEYSQSHSGMARIRIGAAPPLNYATKIPMVTSEVRATDNKNSTPTIR